MGRSVSRSPRVERATHGDRIGGLLDRLPGILAPRPSRVFIPVGINDEVGGHPSEAIAADYRRLVGALNACGVHPLVVWALPCSARADHCDRANPTVAALNRRLAALGPGATYIEAVGTMVVGKRQADRFSDGGVHLSVAGGDTSQRCCARTSDDYRAPNPPMTMRTVRMAISRSSQTEKYLM